MSAPYEAPPIHIAPEALAAWLDALSPTARREVMLSPTAYDKVSDQWDTLTAAKKAAIYNTEPAVRSDVVDISDAATAPKVSILHAADYAPPQPDQEVMDREETRGINPEHPIIVEMATQRAARTVFEVIDWLVSVGDREPQAVNLHRRLDIADTKLVSLCWMLGVREFGKIPLAHLAAEMGLSRAALSHCALIVRDKWNIFNRGQRSDTARDVYAERQRGIWEHRPRQTSGRLLKNTRGAEYLAQNPNATTAELRAELDCSERTASRIMAAHRAQSSKTGADQVTSAPCRDVAFDTEQGA